MVGHWTPGTSGNAICRKRALSGSTAFTGTSIHPLVLAGMLTVYSPTASALSNAPSAFKPAARTVTVCALAALDSR